MKKNISVKTYALYAGVAGFWKVSRTNVPLRKVLMIYV
jgi:hypothetical protein